MQFKISRQSHLRSTLANLFIVDILGFCCLPEKIICKFLKWFMLIDYQKHDFFELRLSTSIQF